jgi:hypothetical protein
MEELHDGQPAIATNPLPKLPSTGRAATAMKMVGLQIDRKTPSDATLHNVVVCTLFQHLMTEEAARSTIDARQIQAYGLPVRRLRAG